MAADIRPARANDIEALSAIEESVFEADRISRKSFARLLASRSASVLVAENGGAVVGYLVVLFRATSRKARLYSIAAAPAREKIAGLGRLLLKAAEAEAMRRGATALRLEVREDNVRAIALYEKNAYRCVGRTDGYYADGAAALRYEKPLGIPLAAASRQPAWVGTARS